MDEVAHFVGEDVSRNLHSKVVNIAFRFCSGSVNNMSGIRHPSTAHHSILEGDVVNSVITLWDDHILFDKLIGSKQDSILAVHSNCSSRIEQSSTRIAQWFFQHTQAAIFCPLVTE